MARVLVTGGTGGLGSELVPRLVAAGHTVRVMSRRPAPEDKASDLEWAQAQLLPPEGLAEAVAGVDAIAHCASSPFRKARQVDVDGTRRLLEAAREAGVSHFLYISIVGIDRIPLPYYKVKLAAEKVIEESGVPYSILRAPQFHSLLDRMLGAMLRFPVGFVPGFAKFQLMDTGEVAERMVTAIAAGPGGRLPDIGGPEVRSASELARAWLKARGKRRLVLPLPAFGKVAAGFRAGFNCAPDARDGRMTWEQWLERKYGSAAQQATGNKEQGE
jgi:uncharacterized protein YbjT (DUF2867 family)